MYNCNKYTRAHRYKTCITTLTGTERDYTPERNSYLLGLLGIAGGYRDFDLGLLSAYYICVTLERCVGMYTTQTET